MIKFNLHVSCDADDEIADEVDDGMVILRHDRVCPHSAPTAR
jgi:hypothetical protein